MEKAFTGPYVLKRRLARDLDAAPVAVDFKQRSSHDAGPGIDD
jgi:hypothetical protein